MRKIFFALVAIPLLAQQVPLQPLAQQVRRIEDALAFIGQPLSAQTSSRIDAAIANADGAKAVQSLEAALAPYVLANVEINPESRVKVLRGDATADLAQGGTRAFLIKVVNFAHVTSPLRVSSPNAAPIVESYRVKPGLEQITQSGIRDRWTQLSFFRKPPLQERLSGLEIEYLILEVFSRDSGPLAAVLGFDHHEFIPGNLGHLGIRINRDGFVIENFGGLVVLTVLKIVVRHGKFAAGQHGFHLVQALFRRRHAGISREKNHVVLVIRNGFLGGRLIVGRPVDEGGVTRRFSGRHPA